MSPALSCRAAAVLLLLCLCAKSGLCQFRTFQNSEYKLFTVKSTFDAAEADCAETFNGHLVSILSPDEASWINTVYLSNIEAASKGDPIDDPVASPSPKAVSSPEVVVEPPNFIASPPADTPSPSPAVGDAPVSSPDVVATPSPDVTVTPSPDVTVTPSPDVTVTPSPDVAVTPSPDAAITDSPPVDATPSPPVSVTPADAAPAGTSTDTSTTGTGTGTTTGTAGAAAGPAGTADTAGTTAAATPSPAPDAAVGRRRALLADAPAAAWIGYKASSGVWTDGKARGYDKFAAPPTTGCGALDGATGQWVQVACATELPYICKRTAGIYSPMVAEAGAPGTPGAPGAPAPATETKKKGINTVALIAGVIPSSIAAAVAIAYTAWKWNQRCKNKHTPDTVLEGAPIAAPMVSYMAKSTTEDYSRAASGGYAREDYSRAMSGGYGREDYSRAMSGGYPRGPGRV